MNKVIAVRGTRSGHNNVVMRASINSLPLISLKGELEKPPIPHDVAKKNEMEKIMWLSAAAEPSTIKYSRRRLRLAKRQLRNAMASVRRTYKDVNSVKSPSIKKSGGSTSG